MRNKILRPSIVKMFMFRIIFKKLEILSLVVLSLALIFCLSTKSFAQDINRGRLNFEETDSSPSVFPYKIIVTNGTLSDNGDGTSSLTTGGGGGSGDVTSVGDCTTGACFDGTSDGGTYLDFYDAQGRTRLIGGNTAGEVNITLPNTTGTLIHTETDPTVDSSAEIQAIIGAAVYEPAGVAVADITDASANGRSLISAANYAAMRGLLDLEAGTDFPALGGATPTGVWDFGGATSVEIPNTAAPTVDAAGEIAIDTTDDQLVYSATPRVISYYAPIAIIINSPTASGDGAAIRMPYAVTIKAVHALCVGGTNWVGHLDECDANGATCVTVDTSDITATAGTNANDDSSLSNATIDSGDYIGVHTTSVSGTPTRAIITLEYTVDRL